VAISAPGAPAPGSVTLPNGAGKELVEPAARSVHRLERVTAEAAGARLGQRSLPTCTTAWAFRDDEAQSITSYLRAQFGELTNDFGS